MAPELLGYPDYKGLDAKTFASDVYSLAIIMWEVGLSPSVLQTHF